MIRLRGYPVSFIILWGLFVAGFTEAQMVVHRGKQTECHAFLEYSDEGAHKSVAIPFLLFVPSDYRSDGDPWPLLLFLHGLGESGTGQLERVKIHGPAGRVERDADFPFILVSPQCPEPPKDDYRSAWRAAQLNALLDYVIPRLNVDRRRIYATGLSMGGYGTWRFGALYPQRFAAFAPICGGGKPEYAAALKDIPVWAFHGAKDSIVPLSESQQMVDAINRLGGDAKLTIYPDVEHNSWDRAYGESDLFEWLLQQRKDD